MEYSKHGDQIRVYDGLAWADFTTSGELIAKSTSKFMGVLSDAQIAKASETIKSFTIAPFTRTVYLRFNDLPESGQSKNHATGKAEAGVSCYALEWDLIAGAYKRCGSGLDGAEISYAIQGAPMYFIAGDECGTGSDGEPLLDNPVVLAGAKYDKDKNGYVVMQQNCSNA